MSARDPAGGQPRVSLIVPTRDHRDLLERLVASLVLTVPRHLSELIVLDNGSRDPATVAYLQALPDADAARHFTSVRVLSAPERFNYSALNNRAVDVAGAPWLCLLNDDVEALRPGWLEGMLERAALPDTGCVGAKLLYPDGRLQHAGVMLGLGPVAGHPYRFHADDPDDADHFLQQDQIVSAVTGACLLVAKATWHAVGGMDEALAVAYNDVDFCLKVRALGLVNRWTPSAVLIHHESVSRGRSRRKGLLRGYRHRREVRLMQRRWGTLLHRDPCLDDRVPLRAR